VEKSVSLSDVTLAILAGGAGSRMGQPKGLLRIQGRPILEYLIEQFHWPGPSWLVTAPGREHPPGWERFDREITDPVSGSGPLRGVLTALEQLDTPLLLVATVDMPGMGNENLTWLVSQITSKTAMGIMCSRRTGNETSVEPFPVLLRKEGLVGVRERLETGRLSVHGLLSDPGFITVTSPTDWNERVWTNLNNLRDFKDYLSGLGRPEG